MSRVRNGLYRVAAGTPLEAPFLRARIREQALPREGFHRTTEEPSLASSVSNGANIRWAVHPRTGAIRFFEEGGGKDRRDLRARPEPHKLHERKLGHVVVNSTTDRPWSHYFCCMALAIARAWRALSWNVASRRTTRRTTSNPMQARSPGAVQPARRAALPRPAPV
jgi:hypothetical protein